MQRGRLLIIIGIILGLVTISLINFLLTTTDMLDGSPKTETESVTIVPEPTGIRTTEVIVALRPIKRGAEFVAGSIGRRDWPANNVHPDMIFDEADTIGKVARHDILPGQVLVRDSLLDISERIFAPPAPIVANEIAYFGQNDGFLYALEAETGKELWRFEAERPTFSRPVVSDGKIFFLGDNGTLYALNARSGRDLWRIIGVDTVYDLDVATPTVVDGTLYFENRSDGIFYAIDAQTGNELWRFKTMGHVDIADGVIYFRDDEGQPLSILDMATGQELELTNNHQN